MTKTKTYLPFLMALSGLLVWVGIAGCGSGDETAAASLPKDKFIKQADLICSDASIEQAKKAAVYLEDHPDAKEADLVVPAGIPPLEKELEELEDLGAPIGQEDAVETYLEEFAQALDDLKAEPEAALTPADNPFDKSNKLASDLKLGDCSDTP